MHFSRPRLAAFSLLVVDLSEWVMELQEAISIETVSCTGALSVHGRFVHPDGA